MPTADRIAPARTPHPDAVAWLALLRQGAADIAALSHCLKMASAMTRPTTGGAR